MLDGGRAQCNGQHSAAKQGVMAQHAVRRQGRAGQGRTGQDTTGPSRWFSMPSGSRAGQGRSQGRAGQDMAHKRKRLDKAGRAEPWQGSERLGPAGHRAGQNRTEQGRAVLTICPAFGKPLDLLILRGAGAEVDLSGVAQEVDGAMVKGVPEGVPAHPIITHVRHAGVIWHLEPLLKRHSALTTCKLMHLTQHSRHTLEPSSTEFLLCSRPCFLNCRPQARVTIPTSSRPVASRHCNSTWAKSANEERQSQPELLPRHKTLEGT